MSTAKISLIIPVYNEAESIEALLGSILSQTRLPDEIIFSDGGSTDNTVQLIKQHPLSQKLTSKILIKSKANCSTSRNLAIKAAKNKILALTDSGCVLAPDWLAKITQPIIKGQADSVAGFYRVKPITAFQQAATPFLATMPDQIDSAVYLPSSRSIAFTKAAWQKAGKYPENLNYCDDLVFAASLKSKTKMKVVPQSLVFWQPVSGWLDFFAKIQHYSSGDVRARYQPHLIKIATIFLRYLIFYLVPPLFFLYIFWPIYKFRRYTKSLSSALLLPLVQLTADLGVITGALSAIILSK